MGFCAFKERGESGFDVMSSVEKRFGEEGRREGMGLVGRVML